MNEFPKFFLKEGPPSREFSDITEFLDQAKAVVRPKWIDFVVRVLMDLPDSNQKTILLNIIQDESHLREMLENERFRELETLRLFGQAELWRGITASISDREKAAITLAQTWLDNLNQSSLEKFSLSKNEVSLFLGLSFAVQSVIDTAYLHQLELADAPGGKKLGPHARIFGYEYLYDESVPYIDVFPEFSDLTSCLEIYSTIVTGQVETGDLPTVYHQLSAYLKTLASSFGSHEVDHEKIVEMWAKVDQEYLRLVQSGCPIILTPWGFLTDGNHVGIELMTTLNLGESSAWHEVSQEYLTLVKEYMNRYEPDFVPNPFIHQYVFARNGLNIPWSGTACAGNNYIVFYDNENDNFGAMIYRSYFREFLDSDTTERRFSRVRGINTVAHETGHLPRMLDEEGYKRMGFRVSVGKIDEAKADTMANIFFLMKLLAPKPSDVTPAEFIEQYIVDYIDELRSSKGHENQDIGIVWYSFSAKLVLLRLFESGAITWSGDRIKIIQGQKGVEALAQAGQEIFDLYGDPNFDEQAVNRYVAHLEVQTEENQDVQRFLAKVYSSQG